MDEDENDEVTIEPEDLGEVPMLTRKTGIDDEPNDE